MGNTYIVMLFGEDNYIIPCSNIQEIKKAMIKLINNEYGNEELIRDYGITPRELYGNIKNAETIDDILTVVYDVEFDVKIRIEELIKNNMIIL